MKLRDAAELVRPAFRAPAVAGEGDEGGKGLPDDG
jgi:hypothetical protein